MSELTENERKILELLLESKRPLSIEELTSKTGMPHSTIMSVIESLSAKGMVSKEITRKFLVKPTSEGLDYASRGVPERRIALQVLKHGGKLRIRDLGDLGFTENEISIGVGWIVKKGWGRIDKGFIVVEREPPRSDDERMLEELTGRGLLELTEDIPQVIRELEKRGLVEISMRTLVKVSASSSVSKALLKAVPVISKITHDIIKRGLWRKARLKPYNIKALPPTVYPGKKHFYVEFLEKIKSILIAMGFREIEGPLVESEFWNFDVLFQAQDHPAREIHDTFWIKYPRRTTLEEEAIVERVRRIHESGGDTGSRGWGYKWRPDIATRLILRSQTTCVTARYLSENPKPPVKVFTIGKVFRPDEIDATHLPEFQQLDGIIMAENLSFKHLLGTLAEFFKQLGIEEVKFKPGYFPFTEPSVEGYINHPKAGWVEAFGAGMFRPEVLASLGVKYPVAAWGIGIDRVAMLFLGIDDIRKLYSTNIDFLRKTLVKW